MISKLISLTIYLLVLTSCSLFIKLDQPDEKIIFKKSIENRLCTIEKEKLILSSSSSSNQELFQERIEIAAKKHNFKAIDVFVAWSLIQIYIRPNLVSPGSTLQFVDTNNKDPFYANYGIDKNKDKFLFFNSLKDLLTKYKSKRSLKFLARIVDDILPYQTSVDKELATFLSSNKSSLAQNKKITDYFFKGDQVLRPGEGLKTFRVWPLVSQASYKKNITNSHLFSFNIAKDKTARCNFDMRIYQNAVYLINNDLGTNSHPYSISYKGKSFFGISSQNPNVSENYDGTYTFSPNRSIVQNAVCFIQTPESNFSMISTRGRDSGQHLFNMIEYNITEAQNSREVLSVLDFPRYLFLLNPERMVYESDRSSEMQTQAFLNTSFPIYHKSNLGNVWIHYKNKKTESLLIDDRVPTYNSCTK